MMSNFYSMSEFKQLGTDSMKSVILNSYKNDYKKIQEELQKELTSNMIDMNKFIELSYFVNNIDKHLNEMIDFYDYSLLCSLYMIYLNAKNKEKNVFYTLNKRYNAYGQNTCLTKVSDIIRLFVKIKNDILKEEMYD